MAKISKIVVHCSASNYGSAIEIDKWHRSRGWRQIGYMGVILNGYIMQRSNSNYWRFSDGVFEWGRPLDTDYEIHGDEIEAHAFGINNQSVGICLIGNTSFTLYQFIKAKEIINHLMKIWDIPISSVIGHYEHDPKKTCPNFDMNLFRSYVSDDENSYESLIKLIERSSND